MLLQTDFTERWNNACEQLRKEGREEGRAEGRVQGREEGIKEGTLKEKLTIAINMLREDCNWQLINRITGLAMDKIEELAKNLKK